MQKSPGTILFSMCFVLCTLFSGFFAAEADDIGIPRNTPSFFVTRSPCVENLFWVITHCDYNTKNGRCKTEFAIAEHKRPENIMKG